MGLRSYLSKPHRAIRAARRKSIHKPRPPPRNYHASRSSGRPLGSGFAPSVLLSATGRACRVLRLVSFASAWLGTETHSVDTHVSPGRVSVPRLVGELPCFGIVAGIVMRPSQGLMVSEGGARASALCSRRPAPRSAEGSPLLT